MLAEVNIITSVVDIHKINGIRPYYDEYIGRKVKNTEFTEDSIWCNPYPIKKYGVNSLKFYEIYIINKIKIYPNKYNLRLLKGKKLGCWCITTDKIYPIVCHGQILLKLILNYKI